MKTRDILIVILSILTLNNTWLAGAEANDELDKLRKQIQDLDQKVRILERNRELEGEAAEAKKKETPRLTAGADGFGFSSADTNFVLRVGAHVQADGRFYVGDHIAGNDTFLLRRVRPIFEGTVFKNYDYRLMLDFGANTATANTVQDAYLNFHYWPGFQIQAGKFKEPVGLERLQSDVNVRFIERGYPTGLVPNRDVGVQLHGTLFDGVLNYAAGVFNGVGDGASADIESSDDRKDIAGRLFAHPFKSTRIEALRGFGLGLAGTYGSQSGALPRYVTPGQQTFFSYLTGTGTASTNVTANGTHWRVVPQAYWYWGPLGVFGEYAFSNQRIRRDARTASGTTSAIHSIQNEGWELSATYLLTGEDNSYQGVKPRSPFNPAEGGFGAWELAARIGQLSIDRNLFSTVAAPNSASKATSWGAGVNWYLNRNIKLSLDYEQTQFRDGSAKAGNVTAQDEKVIFSRAQIAF